MWRTVNEVSNSEFLSLLSENKGKLTIVSKENESHTTVIEPSIVNLQEVINGYYATETFEVYDEDGRLLGYKGLENYYGIFIYWGSEDLVKSVPKGLYGNYYLHSNDKVYTVDSEEGLLTCLEEYAEKGAQLWRQGFLLGQKVES